MKKKMQEFYSAPIATFWSFTVRGKEMHFSVCFDALFIFQMGYLFFLSAFTYIVLVKTPLQPSWPEYYVMCFIFTYAIDHARMVRLGETFYHSSTELQVGGLGNSVEDYLKPAPFSFFRS